MAEERKEINAVSQQKNFKQKLVDAFIPEDVSNVGQYILTDWILPGVWNFIQSGVNSLLPKTKGPSTPPAFSTKPKVANIQNQFAYNKVYDQKNARVMNDIGDYSTIMIPSRADAEMVLDEMRYLCSDIEEGGGGDGKVSVGWVFDRCGIRPIPPESWNWGWRDLRYAHVERYNNGYRIVFPRTISLR